MVYRKFEDTNGIIRSYQSKDIHKQWPNERGQIMIYKTLHGKLKIEQHGHH